MLDCQWLKRIDIFDRAGALEEESRFNYSEDFFNTFEITSDNIRLNFSFFLFT